jgi:uncharacterized protein YydD (DUF2326 family)
MIILSLKSNQESFRTVTFNRGFNLILAERTKESNRQDSRNGLGKSSLIYIIRFCLGSNLNKALNIDELTDWRFTLEIELQGKIYFFSRTVKEPTKIYIDGDCSQWPVRPDSSDGFQSIAPSDLSKNLGIVIFGINPNEDSLKYLPTFGSARGYFIRNSDDGGYLEPFKNFSSQLEWDKQVNNAFLLGLDWTYASRWQSLKDREKKLKQFVSVVQEMQGHIGELEAKRIRLDNELQKQESDIKNFQVHPKYKQIESDASSITRRIHKLADENFTDKGLLEYYRESLIEERDPGITSVLDMYKELGVIMPENIEKRIEDVSTFHSNIIVNRKDFLDSEIQKIEARIAERDTQKAQLDVERKQLMQVLSTHGALDEYNAIQNTLLKLREEYSEIVFKIDSLQKFEQEQSDIKIEKENLYKEARVSLSERLAAREMAVEFFNSNSQVLYNSPGTLSLDVSKNGYTFKISIEREGSHGVNNMNILCYDLTLAKIWKAQGSQFPLIHDSILFADVDERQIASALQLVAKETEQGDFQYICTLNSDTVPMKDFSDGFDINKYVVMTLTDKEPRGGLFGVRFSKK